MNLTVSPFATLQYYDRISRPTGGSLITQKTAGGADSFNVLYTVPAGKRCYVASFVGTLHCVTANTLSTSATQLWLAWNRSGAYNPAVYISGAGMTPGSIASQSGASGLILEAGDTVEAVWRAPGTTGVYNFSAAFAGTEFNT
jgi:hypothetical protein